ncbi:hypothetical protein CALCODRAFT_494552 [Calocera cornea HHB12733]|uniref:Uncharacterized protein n=1 Tax=Calocera cornea HHB12733 TaxID=1353952 RepID=A0A165GYR3_9BASI|nr:hypothetical protein CALCODRAFT_494552 [Calocera cornea HHB12733]
MAALITIPTLPVRSSSLPHHRAATKEPEPTPWLPTRRVYTLREYLASCRESARGAKAADPLGGGGGGRGDV